MLLVQAVTAARWARSSALPPPSPQLPIQPAVTDGLGHVVGCDPVCVGRIGDGLADAEDPVVGPGGKAQLGHGLAQHLFAGQVANRATPARNSAATEWIRAVSTDSSSVNGGIVAVGG